MATEMEEPQRAAVDHPDVAVDRQCPLVQIPVRDVATRIAHDGVIEQDRHRVEPALVGEITPR